MNSASDPGSAATDLPAAARRLAPVITATREETERRRQIPAHLSDALAAAGLYQMYLPRGLGGSEASPLTAFNVIEELAKADCAVAWCVLNANVPALLAAWLPPDAARDMFATPPGLRAAGSLRPQGKAWPVDGGYRLNGQWNFLSGLHNATWLYCTSLIMDGDQPRLAPSGAPVTRGIWVPAAATTCLDTWSVMGLRGTGSHDCVIDDLYVPACHTAAAFTEPTVQLGPLYRPRGLFSMIMPMFAANALGIARAAVDALLALAGQQATTRSTVLLRDRPIVQERLGQAGAIVAAARAYTLQTLTQAWTTQCAADTEPSKDIAQARLAAVHAIHEAVRAVDLVYHTAGTNAIFATHPLERHFRDIHVAVQHNTAFMIHYESAGKVMLGLRPADPGW